MAWHSRAQGWELGARRLRFNASGQLANSRLARRGAGRGGACAVSRRGPRCHPRLARSPSAAGARGPRGSGRAGLRAAPASHRAGGVCAAPAAAELGGSPGVRGTQREVGVERADL